MGPCQETNRLEAKQLRMCLLSKQVVVLREKSKKGQGQPQAQDKSKKKKLTAHKTPRTLQKNYDAVTLRGRTHSQSHRCGTLFPDLTEKKVGMIR